MGIYGLNPKQEEAVLAPDGPLLILAGAGSGKTRTLTHRIAYLISERHVNPYNILAVTFTNKAAGEMKERVRSIVGDTADRMWVSTFHSACMRILRSDIDLLGYDERFTVYDTDDQKTVMKNVCKRLNIDTKRYKERTILSEISSAKNELMDASEYERYVLNDFTKTVYTRCYREYQETLVKNNAVDFDDIIMLTVRLFREFPEVLEKYRERFKYILVDEYQDTNTAQFELIRLLADKYRNLCVVGDDDQSIYRFRGANIRNILDFEEHYPEATVIKLEQNYRSTQYILDAANSVIANNHGRKEKKLWTENGEGKKPSFNQFDTAFEEAEFVVSDIKRHNRTGICGFGSCAVLYRTNAQSRLIEERLIMAGIPYNVVGGINFYSRAEIKDILAYLKVIDSGIDDLSVRRIVNVPKRAIGNATLDKIQDFAESRDLSLFAAMCRAQDVPGLGKTASKVNAFTDLIGVLRAYRDNASLGELISQIIEMTGYEEYLKDLDEEKAEDRIGNVNELVSKAASFSETRPDATLSDFLEEVALVSDLDSTDMTSERVVLMTLHSAKGLEFPVVYLTGMEDGLFPGYMSLSSGDEEDIEEERRLAYVGMTRAEKELIMTGAKARMMRGETQFNPVSRFIKEIPSECLDGYVPRSKKSYRDEYEDDRSMGRGSGYPGSTYIKPVVRKSSNAGAESAQSTKATQSTKAVFPRTSFASLGIQKGSEKTAAPSSIDYGVGDRVRHFKFGAGTVTSIVKEPRDYKVSVDFDAHGTKVMYASFAKLAKE
ncbi:MAG: UvrD-helicase domain-containing protein [Lachnospiraceae bacterium]|nr:UvrD-helicase domain-containing protein [Lachnospiraceae bacterium]